MKIDVEIIKELRQVTGAGIGDCKEALEACSGDMEKAKEHLREKGLSKAFKKSNRDTADGLVAVYTEGPKGAILKLGSETDFVARSERFCALSKCMVRRLYVYGTENIEGFLEFNCSDESSTSVAGEVMAAAAVLGENVVLSGIGVIQLGCKGVVGSYVHNSVGDGLGKAGALVALESSSDSEDVVNFAKQLAMHVVAAKPEALSEDTLSAEVVEREKAIVARQVEALGKPDVVAQKIIDGRMKKFFEEMTLLDQVFILDGATKVCDVIVQKSQQLGCEMRLVGYRLFSIG